jgi:hypothetical protein
VAGSLKLGLQVILAGSPTGCVVNLEGTEDGQTWSTLATWDVAAPHNSGDIVFAIDKPVAQARANLTTLSGGSAPTVTAFIGAA